MGERPVLYLDVDGVCNPWPWLRSNVDRSGWTYERHELEGFAVYLAKDLGAALQELDVEVVWATTWELKADRLIAERVGLPSGLRVLPYRGHWGRKVGGCGKLDVVRADAGDERPMVWVDDELDGEDYEWAEARTGPTLLVKTVGHEGLTLAKVKEVKEWLADVTSERPDPIWKVYRSEDK